MFVYSSAEHHDKSNDKLSDSEFNIIFCQALSISVLYNQLHSLCTNSRLSPEPCSLLLFSNSTFNTEKVADHSKRPNKNLSGYSLKLATEDYDCPANSIFSVLIIEYNNNNNNNFNNNKYNFNNSNNGLISVHPWYGSLPDIR